MTFVAHYKCGVYVSSYEMTQTRIQDLARILSWGRIVYSVEHIVADAVCGDSSVKYGEPRWSKFKIIHRRLS